MEALFHPLPLVMNKRDSGESTVLPGEWQPLIVETSNTKQSLQPASQVLIVRYDDETIRSHLAIAP